MPPAFLANWKFIAAGVAGLVVLGLALALWVQTERVGNATMRADAEHRNAAQWESNFNDAKAVAQQNAIAMDQYRAKAEAADRAAAAAQAQNQAMATSLAQIKKELHNVASTDDRPVSRVLGYVFDRLQRCTAAGATGDCAQGGGIPAGATGTVSVRAIGADPKP